MTFQRTFGLTKSSIFCYLVKTFYTIIIIIFCQVFVAWVQQISAILVDTANLRGYGNLEGYF
jgi:hypothetical protein